MSRLDAGLLEELPNEFTALARWSSRVFVGPFAGDQDAASGDAEVLRLVGFALAASGCHGVPGAFGLDAIEQPDGATRRAGCDQEFGVQPAGMVVFRVGGVFAEPRSLTDALG
jgi:hypothetical protein